MRTPRDALKFVQVNVNPLLQITHKSAQEACFTEELETVSTAKSNGSVWKFRAIKSSPVRGYLNPDADEAVVLSHDKNVYKLKAAYKMSRTCFYFS